MRWPNLGRAVKSHADPRSGIMTQHLAPGYSACGRCRTAWKFVKGHSTILGNGDGMFPLCEMCWADFTPEQRLPFYYVLFCQWEWDAAGQPFDYQWEDIERAVLTEDANKSGPGKPAARK
jgi:hypothetical protein